ncbi:MAG: hypothetical protein H8D23_23195 [Candidatus Brocadiales bacterium]|nr:hypothetical protein [Candidatus Brocadiales bacterium]
MAVTDFFNQTITLYNKSSYDKYGKMVVGSGTSVSARVQEDTKNVVLTNGQVITILATVYVAPSTTVSVNDKVTYSSVNYKVFRKYKTVDGKGDANHIKLELIKWTE